EKQFGLWAKRKDGDWERITNFDVRYHQWSDFDAKPFISWTTSDSSVATVNNDPLAPRRGLVTGKALGDCTLTAAFRGMTAVYPIKVITWDQPDLDLMYVERFPKFSFDGTKMWPRDGSFLDTLPANGKRWPDEGETVTSVVHYGNFGFQPAPASKIKFELVSDDNENFVLDDADTVKFSTVIETEPLAPGETAEKDVNWTWPKKSQGEHQVFVRVTIDPDETLDEVCEANNQRCELNTGHAFMWRYDAELFEDYYSNKRINHIGSFSLFDWSNAQVDRLSNLLHETVLPTTSSVGIKDSIRVDNYFPQTCDRWDDEPDIWTRELFCDDWYGEYEPENHSPLDFDPAVDHELTHG
ncbi:MAG TPA: CARDB domain-containing protein, partial [Armatimonadota bacterium]|nr:CARDB domain-containing protein [Armatimonadota bacterium]